MKDGLLALILIFSLGCSSISDSETIAPLNTVKIEWEPTRVALFTLGLDRDPRIDDWSKLNPDHFVLTDLKEAIYSGQVKSRITGKVYTCYLKKGDILKVPVYSTESLEP